MYLAATLSPPSFCRRIQRSLGFGGCVLIFQLPVQSQPALSSALQSAPCPLSTAKLLSENGADPNIAASWPAGTPRGRPPRQISPIHQALKRGESLRLVELLLQHGVEPSRSSQALITAVQHEKPAEFRLLVEKGARLSARYRRMSVAQKAMNSGCQAIIDVLFEREITPDTIHG